MVVSVIHYHGTPITPDACALEVLKARHGFVSWATAQQIRLAAEVCQSFAIDNGAFIFWKNGGKPSWPDFYKWLDDWINHPRLDFVVIPDVIGGSEDENDALIEQWPHGDFKGAPVWHTNESIGRLQRLAATFPRVCIGSSGEYDVSRRSAYLDHVRKALYSICDLHGFPTTKIHLLRGLNPAVFSELPVSSADSTNVARNIGIDQAWKGTYQPRSKTVRARILVDRIEYHNSKCRLEMGWE